MEISRTGIVQILTAKHRVGAAHRSGRPGVVIIIDDRDRGGGLRWRGRLHHGRGLLDVNRSRHDRRDISWPSVNRPIIIVTIAKTESVVRTIILVVSAIITMRRIIVRRRKSYTDVAPKRTGIIT